jgi:hypothetical protein
MLFNISVLSFFYFFIFVNIFLKTLGEKMKNLLVKIYLLLTVTLIFVSSATAWDDTGHKLTTYIAWERMTPQARERAIKILLSAPEDSDLSVFYLQDSRSNAAKQRELFMIASTWADIVRNRDFKNRYKKYHQGNWHYADTFWRQTNGKVEILENFNEETGKAVEKLFDFEKVLQNSSASDEDKAIALAWLLHLGGDIHQPLHTSARITELEPKGDQGGNLFELTPKGTPRENQVNLHWFWDSIVGRNVPRQNDACDSDYLPAIANKITKTYPYSKMQNRLRLGQFNVWQQESFRLATTEVFSPMLVRYQMPSEKYKRRTFEISQEQIALAGYRLGEMLNRIFGNQSLPKEANENGGTIKQGANDVRLWTQVRMALTATDDL